MSPNQARQVVERPIGYLETVVDDEIPLTTSEDGLPPLATPRVKRTSPILAVFLLMAIVGLAAGVALAMTRANAIASSNAKLGQRVQELERVLSLQTTTSPPQPSTNVQRSIAAVAADLDTYKQTLGTVESRLDAMAQAAEEQAGPLDGPTAADLRQLQSQIDALNSSVAELSFGVEILEGLVDDQETNSSAHSSPPTGEGNETSAKLLERSFQLVEALSGRVAKVETAVGQLYITVEQEASSPVCRCNVFAGEITVNGSINGVTVQTDPASDNAIIQGSDVTLLSREAVRTTGDQEIFGGLRVSSLGLATSGNADTRWELAVSGDGNVEWSELDFTGKRPACHSSASFLVSGSTSDLNGCYALSGSAFGHNHYVKVSFIGGVASSPAMHAYKIDETWWLGLDNYTADSYSHTWTREFASYRKDMWFDGVYQGSGRWKSRQEETVEHFISPTTFELVLPITYGHGFVGLAHSSRRSTVAPATTTQVTSEPATEPSTEPSTEPFADFTEPITTTPKVETIQPTTVEPTSIPQQTNGPPTDGWTQGVVVTYL